ncbi:glycosyl hydrolase [Pedobacter sp. JCM 36344]|uniref:glycosyl hydrolase n=1 Tax=Pedobacter sp. JCM 36344 TaxID=3374280 RepID=UPI00397C1D78
MNKLLFKASILGTYAIILLLLSPFSVISQQKSLSKDPLESNFLNPPTHAKPYVWWHWMGSNYSKSGITKDLEAMKAMGIGGATIFNLSSSVQESHVPILNNPWPEQTYRSPAYWDAMKHAAAEAKRLGLEIGLHNTVGYSTTGGPWVTEERSMKKLVWRKVIVNSNNIQELTIEKPDPVVDQGWGRRDLPPVPSTWYKDIAYLAIATADTAKFEQVKNLTTYFDSTGKLIKPLPQGDWIIYRMGYASTMSTPHPVPDELITKCLEADKMSAEQSNFHWNTVLDPVKKHLAPYLGNSFKHMLIDSYEAGNQNWTDNFQEEFIKYKGYDPLPWLLTFSQTITNSKTEPKVRNSTEQTARFEWDYKDVINKLYFENGWRIGKKLLSDAKLQLQFEAYGGPFDTQEGSALADIPMAEFWTGSNANIDSNIVSAARAAGRTVVGAEAFTGSPNLSQYTEDPAFLKPTAVGAYSAGINRLILHHWVHQPFDDKYQPGMSMGWWGTHFSRYQTWAEPGKAFFSWLGRTQAMLQYGEQTADYLCLENAQNQASDVISKNDFLSSTIKVIDGKILLPSGRQYPFLVLPKSNKMLPEVLVKLKQLVTDGAIIVGSKPSQSYSLQNFPACDQSVAKMANDMWGSSSQNQYGKGFLFTNIKDAFAKVTFTSTYIVERADSVQAVKVIHRTGENGDVFFVGNVGKNAQNILVSFKIMGMQPELWQPENGIMMKAPIWKEENGRTVVQLSLKDYQAIFIVFRKSVAKQDHTTSITWQNNTIVNYGITKKNVPFASSAIAANAVVQYVSGKTKNIKVKPMKTIPVTGDWMVNFQPKLDSGFIAKFKALKDFNLHPENRIKYFAGTAVYKNKLSIPAASITTKKQLILDLGTLNDIVSVKVNGKDLGVIWYPPYVIDISSAAKAGINTLEIAVTNNWANRLIGDEQEPADFERGIDRGERGLAMKSYPEWFIKNQPRPAQGRKTFSIWYYYRPNSKLRQAGLTGPVQLNIQDAVTF